MLTWKEGPAALGCKTDLGWPGFVDDKVVMPVVFAINRYSSMVGWTIYSIGKIFLYYISVVIRSFLKCIHNISYIVTHTYNSQPANSPIPISSETTCTSVAVYIVKKKQPEALGSYLHCPGSEHSIVQAFLSTPSKNFKHKHSRSV